MSKGLIGLLAALISAAPVVEGSPLTLEDVFELEFAAAPQVSPDGSTLIYERRSFDIMTDRQRSNLWQMKTDGSAHQPLFSGKDNYRQGRFSASGDRLAYLATVEGDSQLYVRYLDSGNTVRVTNLQGTPSGLSWSPDGKWLAYVMFTPTAAESLAVDLPSAPKGAKWAGKASYIDSVNYRADGGGYAKSGQRQLYIVPAEGGTPRPLTDDPFPKGSTLTWAADSKAVYFDSDRRQQWQLDPRQGDIFRVAIDGGAISAVTDRSGPESTPQVSPNGKQIAYLQAPDSDLAHVNNSLFVMNIDGSNRRELTPKLDRGVGSPKWAKDGSGIYFSYTDAGVRRVGFVSLNGKMMTFDVNLGGQAIGRPYDSGDYIPTPKGIVVTTAKPEQPADLALVTKAGKVTPLTQLNHDLFSQRDSAQVSALQVKSSVDGRTIDAWFALPPNFDRSKRYPLILEIHGGPHAAYGPNFSMEVQLMAAAGYVVVWSNPRGSSSYGSDFANLIHHNYPSNDHNDLMDVVDGVIAKGYVDPNQLFITGGSGGGTLTAWAIGKTDRFKAAVVAKPVINWMSFALTADMYPYFSKFWLPGKPWEHSQHLWQRSPLSLVGNVTTPTMLLTGMDDYRTPMSETEQYYQALKLNKVDAALVRIPNASHSIAARPSNLMQKVGYILAWFEKHRAR